MQNVAAPEMYDLDYVYPILPYSTNSPVEGPPSLLPVESFRPQGMTRSGKAETYMERTYSAPLALLRGDVMIPHADVTRQRRGTVNMHTIPHAHIEVKKGEHATENVRDEGKQQAFDRSQGSNHVEEIIRSTLRVLGQSSHVVVVGSHTFELRTVKTKNIWSVQENGHLILRPSMCPLTYSCQGKYLLYERTYITSVGVYGGCGAAATCTMCGEEHKPPSSLISPVVAKTISHVRAPGTVTLPVTADSRAGL